MVIIAVFSIMKPHAFLSSFDIKTIFMNASVALMLSVGMTYVIITAGIDLSVGWVLVMSGALAAKVMIALGGGAAAAGSAEWGPIAAGPAVGLLVGIGWGVINGVLIALLDNPPLIVTLGTFGMALGLADVITGGVDVSGIPTRLDTTIGSGQLGPIPWLVVIAVVVTIVLGLVLHLTRFGRYTYAIGSNAEAVRRAGINVNWHLIKVYALAGLLSGVGGNLSLAYFTTTTTHRPADQVHPHRPGGANQGQLGGDEQVHLPEQLLDRRHRAAAAASGPGCWSGFRNRQVGHATDTRMNCLSALRVVAIRFGPCAP